MDTESELEVARVITEDAGDVDNAPGDSTNIVEPLPASPTSSTASLKRPAGDMDDERDIQPETSNKRRKRESVGGADESGDGTDAARLVREMEVELGCPCCSALCYNPVIALPCQHYFCGSCYTMWTRYTGVTCPTCRQAVNQVIPSRAIQSIIEVYLRSVPSKARLPREKEQADEIYTAGSNIRIPTPRPRSPELAPPQDNDAYYRPCPHCNSPNDFNWVCPQPIIDPSVDISRASLLANGPPPGHATCGSCEHLHAIGSPSTSRCDFCRKTFCGLVSPQRCHAKRVRETKPALLEGLSDLILTPEAYPSFGVNTVEWEYLVDYLRDQGISPRHIYVTIVENVLGGPEKWKPLFDLGMFPAAVAAALNDTQQRQRNVETDSASTSGSEAGAAGGSDEQQDDDNSRDAEMPEVPHRLPDTSTNPTSDALTVPQLPTSAPPASNSNPEQVPTPLHDTEMPDAAPSQSAPADLVIPEHVADAIAAASALVDAILATDDGTSPVETRAITPISVPTPQLEVDNVSILLDSAAAEFVLPFEVEPISVPPAPHVATDNSQEPEGSPSTSDSASGTAVTSISGSESVPSIPPSNSNEGPTDLSPTGAAQEGASIPDANSGANSSASANAANPSSRPRAVNLHLSKICRACALEVFYWGAKQWWIKERANAHTEGTLPRVVRERKDCPEMFQYVKKEGEEGDGELVVGICPQEDDHSHAREFNHIPRPLGWVPPPPRPPTPEQPPESAESTQGQPTNTSPDGQDSDGDSEEEENQILGAEMVDVVPQQSAAVPDAAAVSNSASATSSTQDPVLERPAGETETSVSTISATASTTVPGETPSGGSSGASHVPSSVDRMEIDIPSLPTSEDRLVIPPAAHTERHTEDMAMTSSAAGSQAPAAVQA